MQRWMGGVLKGLLTRTKINLQPSLWNYETCYFMSNTYASGTLCHRDSWTKHNSGGLIIHPPSKFAFCEIAKNGCSQWTTVLAKLFYDNINIENSHFDLSLRSFEKYGIEGVNSIFSDPPMLRRLSWSVIHLPGLLLHIWTNNVLQWIVKIHFVFLEGRPGFKRASQLHSAWLSTGSWNKMLLTLTLTGNSSLSIVTWGQISMITTLLHLWIRAICPLMHLASWTLLGSTITINRTVRPSSPSGNHTRWRSIARNLSRMFWRSFILQA